ncbi:MAG: yoeB 2 [Flaviaesturariibacter sp.]|nr:yoeB 2 [Flaviaesturariibacter sp.]
MEIIFQPQALEDLQHWKKSGDEKILKKIRELLENIQETPFEGIGKPEPLKHSLAGKWSRRITGEHRLVYKVEKEVITIYQVRFHY